MKLSLFVSKENNEFSKIYRSALGIESLCDILHVCDLMYACFGLIFYFHASLSHGKQLSLEAGENGFFLYEMIVFSVVTDLCFMANNKTCATTENVMCAQRIAIFKRNFFSGRRVSHRDDLDGVFQETTHMLWMRLNSLFIINIYEQRSNCVWWPSIVYSFVSTKMSGSGSGPAPDPGLFYLSVDNFLDFPIRSKFNVHPLSAIWDVVANIAHLLQTND